MKIDNGSVLFAHSRTQKPQATEQNAANPFAAILAEQQKADASGKVAPSSHAERSRETYDFTHMTPTALQETVNGLMSRGQLDLDDTSSLLGMMPPTALSKVNYDGAAPAGAEVPMNVFSRIQDAIEGARSRNETSSIAGLQRAAEALARFQEPSISVQV